MDLKFLFFLGGGNNDGKTYVQDYYILLYNMPQPTLIVQLRAQLLILSNGLVDKWEPKETWER